MMETKKIYDEDSYIKEFDATVISSEKEGKYFKTVLDKTAFFPEAGGQPCDNGTINGLEVKDVQIKDGNIYHFLEKGLENGQKIKGVINFERRFSFMQNHSGEHIVSGVINSLYGFQNVGFHLNEEVATLDFDGILDRNDLDKIENVANRKIWENNKVIAYYPTREELKNLKFRQKKEIDGNIRIVNILNTDICACCAPHVKNTGEIGLIKLLSFEKMRGGTRIYMKCGNLALADYQNKLLNITEIQNLLSSKAEDTAKAVNLLYEKLNEQKQKNINLKKRLMEFMVGNASADENLFLVSDFEMKDLQMFSDMLYKKHKATKTVLSKKDNNTYLFAICGEDTDAKKVFLKLKENLDVNGGGRNGMLSGIINADYKEIKGVTQNI